MNMKKQLQDLAHARIALGAHTETMAPMFGPFANVGAPFFEQVNLAERRLVLALAISDMQKGLETYMLEKAIKEDPGGMRMNELRGLEKMLVDRMRKFNVNGDLEKAAKDLLGDGLPEAE